MELTVIAILVATILVLASLHLAGRALAVISTVLCSAMITYFVMPPYLSFRVSRTRDLVMIACFGVMGLVVSRSGAHSRARSRRSSPGGQPLGPRFTGSTTALSQAVAEVMSTGLGDLLRETGVGIDSRESDLPCSHSEAVGILQSILMDSLDCGTRRISIDVSRRPDTWRLSIAAHRVWPAPSDETITIGRRAALCTDINFPVWPARFRVNSFDNRCDRVYQVYMDANPAEPSGEPAGDVHPSAQSA
jgi:hypothetical protein